MAALQHFALGCCILCALAGLLNVFWPDNSYKPVINTVLVLYTLASVAQSGRNVDWNALRRSVRQLPVQQSAAQQSLDGYARALGRQASAQALAQTLRQAGIPCETAWEGECCIFYLSDASDSGPAAALLNRNAGTLRWRTETAETETGVTP